VRELLSQRCTFAIAQNDQVDSAPSSGVVYETPKLFIDSRQFAVEDDELIRYVSQNPERTFGAPYSVHDPTLVSKVQYNRIAKIAIVHDNEGGPKVW
jgi:hypothetical protein